MFCNNENLASCFLRTAPGDKQQRHLERILQKMTLPLPEAREYSASADGGLIVFLNEPGCVLRINRADDYSDRDVLTHPHILRPLGSRHAQGVRIDVFPAIPCPVSAEDASKLEELLNKDGYLYYDKKPLNAGYLPVHGQDRNMPVVIDTNAVISLPQKRSLQPVSNDSKIQEQLYAPLHAAFDRAWPKKSALPDLQKMQHFWDLCHQFKTEGKLVTSWLSREWAQASGDWLNAHGYRPQANTSYKNAIAGSRAYEKRWAASRGTPKIS